MFILSSVLFRCYQWGINVEFSDEASPQYIPLIRSSFPSLTGWCNNPEFYIILRFKYFRDFNTGIVHP